MHSPLSLIRPMALVLAVALALTACSSDTDAERGDAEVPQAQFPPSVEAGQIPLIDRFANRLVVFDLGQTAVVSRPSADQTFQYALPVRWPSTIITSGDSNESRSELVEMTDGGVRVLHDLDRAAFPIARSGDTTYLQMSEIRPDSSLGATSLARYTLGGEVEQISELDSHITNAVVADERLWYTTDAATEGRFDLWSAALTGDFKPRSERRDLRTGRLFVVDDEVIVNDAFGKGLPRVDCSLHCLVDDQGGHVFSLGSGETSLTLSAVNLDSGASEIVAEGEIVDFFTRGSTLTIYRTGAVTTLDRKDLP